MPRRLGEPRHRGLARYVRNKRNGAGNLSTFFIKRSANKKTLDGLLYLPPVHVDDGNIRCADAVAEELRKHFRDDPMVELSSMERQEIGKPVEFTGLQFTGEESGEWLDQDIYNRIK